METETVYLLIEYHLPDMGFRKNSQQYIHIFDSIESIKAHIEKEKKEYGGQTYRYQYEVLKTKRVKLDLTT